MMGKFPFWCPNCSAVEVSTDGAICPACQHAGQWASARMNLANFINSVNCGYPSIPDWPVGTRVAIEADNVYNDVNLDTIPVPDGWERVETDWFRCPQKHENWLEADKSGKVHGVSGTCNLPDICRVILGLADPRRIIVRRKKMKKRYLVIRCELNSLSLPDDPSSAEITIRGKAPFSGSPSMYAIHGAPFTIEEVEE